MTAAAFDGPARRAQVRCGRLTLTYCAFAGLAMVVNLGSQWIVLRLGLLVPHVPGFFVVTASTAVGTAAGLLLKYGLDKRFIFQDRATGARAHARRFSLYAAGGLFTTAIPYALELIARGYFPRGPGVLVAGAVGLVIGYAVKFRLDRRFVFNRP